MEAYADLLDGQGSVCAICNQPETRKSNGDQIKRLAIDHDHKTNEIRGLLCHDCNVGIGYFKDDVSILLKAIYYLKGEEI